MAVQVYTVAYLCEFPTLLGGERSMLAFLAHREQAGVQPVVVAPGQGPLFDALSAERIATVAWPPRGRHAAETLAPRLREHGVRLVHANSLMTAGAARDLGRALDVPAVAHVRDIMTLSIRQRECLSGLAAVVAVSNAVRDALGNQGVSIDRIERIYNAVDADALQRAAHPGAFLQALSIPTDVPLIGCIGQIALRKGQDTFLEAAVRLANEFPDAHFVIAGARYSQKQESRAFEEALHARAMRPPLAGRFHFPGYRDDVPALLADLDVLVVPSRQEPLSRTLLEGLALGVPAVATSVGGTPEIVTDGDTGLLVPPDDPEAMAQAVGRLLGEPPLRTKLRAAGPRRVREAFSPCRQVEAIRALYARLPG